MKKTVLSLIAVVSLFFPALIFAQQIAPQGIYLSDLQQLLNLLLQELAGLEQQLAVLQQNQQTLQNEVASSTASTTPATLATSTTAAPVITTSTPNPSPTLTQIQQTNPQVFEAAAPPVTMSYYSFQVYASSLGGSVHATGTTDKIGTITLTASSSDVFLDGLVLSFSGSGASDSFLVPADIFLLDAGGAPVQVPKIYYPTAAINNGGGKMQWRFGDNSGGLKIPSGTSLTYTLAIDSSAFSSSTAFSAEVDTVDWEGTMSGLSGDFSYNQYLGGGGLLPIAINSVGY